MILFTPPSCVSSFSECRVFLFSFEYKSLLYLVYVIKSSSGRIAIRLSVTLSLNLASTWMRCGNLGDRCSFHTKPTKLASGWVGCDASNLCTLTVRELWDRRRRIFYYKFKMSPGVFTCIILTGRGIFDGGRNMGARSTNRGGSANRASE